VPFKPLRKGQQVIAAFVIKGPRSKSEQQEFKKQLRALLTKNKSRLVK
jgi:hypothetical protein